MDIISNVKAGIGLMWQSCVNTFKKNVVLIKTGREGSVCEPTSCRMTQEHTYVFAVL